MAASNQGQQPGTSEGHPRELEDLTPRNLKILRDAAANEDCPTTAIAMNKEVLFNSIMKIRESVREERPELDSMDTEELKKAYAKLKIEALREMANNEDPVFCEVLQFVYTHFRYEEIESIDIEVFAACHKAAMLHRCLDRNVEGVVVHDGNGQ